MEGTMDNTTTYQVKLVSRDAVEQALVALNKRATRRGVPNFTWTWGKPTTETKFVGDDKVLARGVRLVHHNVVTSRYEVAVDMIELTLPEQIPVINGWRFVASLEHVDGANIIHEVPGETVPEVYRNRGSHCDHCRYIRQRNDTYVLCHEDGRTMQVGSTCIKDFLGNDAAHNVALAATMISSIPELLRSIDDGLGGFGGGSSDCLAIVPFLQNVAACIRMNGWVSRTASKDGGATATVDVVLSELDKRAPQWTVSDDDKGLAERALLWAEMLTDEQVNADKGNYLHNVRTVANSGVIRFRNAGIAASIIAAYQRAVGEAKRAEGKREQSNLHVGTVGKRDTFADAQLDYVAGYATQYGYTTVLTFVLGNGAVLVWKASNTDLSKEDIGKRFNIVGSVKTHGDYKGKSQTYLTRCKLEQVA